MATYPKCDRFNCFGNKCGSRCNVLSFQEDPENCSFFKTDEELDDGRIEAHNHLKAIGRQDLIRKYEYNPQRKW